MWSVDRRWSGLTVSFLLKPAHKRSGWTVSARFSYFSLFIKSGPRTPGGHISKKKPFNLSILYNNDFREPIFRGIIFFGKSLKVKLYKVVNADKWYSARSNIVNLKDQRFTPLNFKDIEITKFDFVAFSVVMLWYISGACCGNICICITICKSHNSQINFPTFWDQKSQVSDKVPWSLQRSI